MVDRLSQPKNKTIPAEPAVNLNMELVEGAFETYDMEMQQAFEANKVDHFHRVIREQRKRVKEVYS